MTIVRNTVAVAVCLIVTAAFGADAPSPDTPTAAPSDGVITPAGQKLAAFLDGTDVEHHWLPKSYVDWKTGEATDRPEKGAVKSSHCSAYAAAVAERLGVYLLCPPEHTQSLLANAQYAWLQGSGVGKGWNAVATAEDAQARANAGQLVVVVYQAPDPKKPGHIAVVHPAVKTVDALDKDGPEITQAGATNYDETTVSVGFNHHPGAWDATGKAVKFFSHPLPEKSDD